MKRWIVIFLMIAGLVYAQKEIHEITATTTLDSADACIVDFDSLQNGSYKTRSILWYHLIRSLDGNGLAASGDTVNVGVDDSTIELSSDLLQVKNSGITWGKLADAVQDSIQTAGEGTVKGTGTATYLPKFVDTDSLANSIITDDGSGNITATSATSAKPNFYLSNTNADAESGILTFLKDSASPDDDNELGEIAFIGDDHLGYATQFVRLFGYSADVTNTDEAGAFKVKLIMDGVLTEYLSMSAYNGSVGQGEIFFNDESKDVNSRFESDGNANAFVIDGGADKIGMMSAVGDSTVKIDGSVEITEGVRVDGEVELKGQETILSNTDIGGPNLTLTNTNNLSAGASITFKQLGDAGQAGDVPGVIEWNAYDGGSTERTFGGIEGYVDYATAADASGRILFKGLMDSVETVFFQYEGHATGVGVGQFLGNANNLKIHFAWDTDNVEEAFKVDAVNDLINHNVDVLQDSNIYVNWGTISGSGGYGLRDVDGDVQYKMYGGSWTSLAASTSGGWTLASDTTSTDKYVGIGLTQPNDLVQIKSSTNGKGLTLQRNSTDADTYIDLSFLMSTTDAAGPVTWLRVYRRTSSTDADMVFHVGGNDVMYLNDEGNLGVGSSAPDSARLQVYSALDHDFWVGNTSIYSHMKAADAQFTTSSDISKKTDIKEIKDLIPDEDLFDKFLKIVPVEFRWKPEFFVRPFPTGEYVAKLDTTWSDSLCSAKLNEWRTEWTQKEWSSAIDQGRRIRYSLSAQSVGEALYDIEGMKEVDWNKVATYHIAATQALARTVISQGEKIDVMEVAIADLLKRVEELENR